MKKKQLCHHFQCQLSYFRHFQRDEFKLKFANQNTAMDTFSAWHYGNTNCTLNNCLVVIDECVFEIYNQEIVFSKKYYF